MDLILNLPPLSSDTAAAPWRGEDTLCHGALALPPLLLITMFPACSFSLSSCALPPANFFKDVVGFSRSSRDHVQREEAKGFFAWAQSHCYILIFFYSDGGVAASLTNTFPLLFLFAAPAHRE